MEEATEEELMDACARADLTGMFNCPHTGRSCCSPLCRSFQRSASAVDLVTALLVKQP